MKLSYIFPLWMLSIKINSLYTFRWVLLLSSFSYIFVSESVCKHAKVYVKSAKFILRYRSLPFFLEEGLFVVNCQLISLADLRISLSAIHPLVEALELQTHALCGFLWIQLLSSHL